MNTSRKIRVNNNSVYSAFVCSSARQKKRSITKMFHCVINFTWLLFSLYVTYRAVPNRKRKLWVPVIQVYEEISKEFSHNFPEKRGQCNLSSHGLMPWWEWRFSQVDIVHVSLERSWEGTQDFWKYYVGNLWCFLISAWKKKKKVEKPQAKVIM